MNTFHMRLVSNLQRSPVFYGCFLLMAIGTLLLLVSTGCSGGKKSSSSVKIISAVYGVSTNFVDVSAQVENMVDLKMEFKVQPGFLQTDPSPGWNKTLVVLYEFRGRRHVLTAGEGKSVSTSILEQAALR
jgi:hypothetical protein